VQRLVDRLLLGVECLGTDTGEIVVRKEWAIAASGEEPATKPRASTAAWFKKRDQGDDAKHGQQSTASRDSINQRSGGRYRTQ
jgi:hypothetical protein